MSGKEQQLKVQLKVLQDFFNQRSIQTTKGDSTKDLEAVKHTITQILNYPLEKHEYASIQYAIKLFEYFKEYKNRCFVTEEEKNNWIATCSALSDEVKNLSGYENVLLDTLSMELGSMAIVCSVMALYMLQFALFSHGALIVTFVFVLAASLLLGLSFIMGLMSKKSGLPAIFDGLSKCLVGDADAIQNLPSNEECLSNISYRSDRSYFSFTSTELKNVTLSSPSKNSSQSSFDIIDKSGIDSENLSESSFDIINEEDFSDEQPIDSLRPSG